MFGEVRNGGAAVNEYGKVAQRCWEEIPWHYNDVELDEYGNEMEDESELDEFLED